jgi:hypothetical protein
MCKAVFTTADLSSCIHRCLLLMMRANFPLYAGSNFADISADTSLAGMYTAFPGHAFAENETLKTLVDITVDNPSSYISRPARCHITCRPYSSSKH